MEAEFASSRGFAAITPALAAAAESLRRTEPLPGGIVVACTRAGAIGTMPFGVADAGRNLPVSAAHLFEIGSISKFLASVLVGRLVDSGRVRLDDLATAHLPWLDMGGHTGRITLAHLLAHTAGLVCGVDALTDERAQAWSLRHRASFEPGTRFYYSNVGYVVAGLLVSAIAGRHHGDVLEREVFAPLGLSGAVGSIRNADRGRLAVGYAPAIDDRPWLPGDPIAPATWLEAFGADGNVAMDASGMAGLLRLLLGDGSAGGVRILDADSMRRITTPAAPGGEPVLAPHAGLPVTSSRYGLGINVETIGGATCVTHGGGMVGYASFVLADPERDVAVGVMTNANGDCLAAQALARYAHRLLAGGGACGPDADAAHTDPAVRAAASPAAELDGLAGTDARGVEVAVTVEREGGSGRLRCRTPDGSGTLFRDLGGRFATDHPGLRSQYLHRHSERAVDPGDHSMPSAASGAGTPAGSAAAPLLAGHYRAHNPWFSTFRIVQRGATAFLTATGGVEAPSDDEVLVPLGDGSFRVGQEPWRPERLRTIAQVGGDAVLVDLGGCRYSRTPAG